MASQNTILRRALEHELELKAIGKFVPFPKNIHRKEKKEYMKRTGMSGKYYRKFCKRIKRKTFNQIDQFKSLDSVMLSDYTSRDFKHQSEKHEESTS
jgi:hypothetical protein